MQSGIAAFLQGFLANSVDALLVFSADGDIRAANPVACAWLGRSEQEIRRAGWSGLLAEPALHPADFHDAGAGHRQLRFLHPDGSHLRAEVSTLKLPAGDAGAGLVLVIRPVGDDGNALSEAVRLVDHATDRALRAVASMVGLRDTYTADHDERTGRLAAAIARELGWAEARCGHLQLVGLVHDVGKIAVPAEILAKPSSLTPIEFRIVQRHVQAGYDVLRDIPHPLPIAEIVLQHHERLDGSGYPRGLRGDAILPEARLLAVADAVDAMTSHQPWRAALAPAAALAELQARRDVQYDGAAIDAVAKVMAKGVP